MVFRILNGFLIRSLIMFSHAHFGLSAELIFAKIFSHFGTILLQFVPYRRQSLKSRFQAYSFPISRHFLREVTLHPQPAHFSKPLIHRMATDSKMQLLVTTNKFSFKHISRTSSVAVCRVSVPAYVYARLLSEIYRLGHHHCQFPLCLP